jgi:hypothetical protein
MYWQEAKPQRVDSLIGVDWESIGRLVRARALQAVGLHLAIKAGHVDADLNATGASVALEESLG